MYFYIFMCPALGSVSHLGEVPISRKCSSSLYITAWEDRAGKIIIELETIGRCIQQKGKQRGIYRYGYLDKNKGSKWVMVNVTTCQGGQKV